VTLALLAALVGMLGYGIASVLQATGAARASGPAVLRHPAYVAGLALDGVAWLASLVAVRHLPLFVVQSLLAGSLGVTVLLARFFLGARLRRRDAWAVAVVGVALATVAGAAGDQSARLAPAGFTVAALGALLLTGLVTVALYRRGGSLPLATASGIAFSGAALCARALPNGGWRALATEPLAWAVVGFGVLGAIGYARSLERGAVGPATAVLWAMEVLVPGVIGVVVLNDAIRPGWALPALLAVAAVVAACTVLATTPPSRAPEAPRVR
jgi:drug/metabolite transporter (DMT)-like permease